MTFNVGKMFKVLGWIIISGTLALQTMAAESSTRGNFRAVQQAVSVIGLEIRNLQDEPLGTVKDLALDLEHGRLVEVIVASGGFLGFGQRTVAVPPQAFIFDTIHGFLRLEVDQQTFKAAPDFAMSKWAEHCQSSRVAEVYRYYGQAPYFAADGQDSQSGNTATEPLGYVQRSRKLLRLPVKNRQNEPLGLIDAFLYTLQSGRVLHVIVLDAGSRETKNVIPALALRFNPAHDTLYFDVSRQAFKSEPRFKWTDGGHGESQPEIYSDFRQETYSNIKVKANDGVNTRQNFQEGAAHTYIPLTQGSSFADVDLTRKIYAAIWANTRLSQNAQNVEVGTVNGRVTLRGQVNTEASKRIINQIATLNARPENVSNLLEVRPVLFTPKQTN